MALTRPCGVRENPLAVEFAILGPLKISDGGRELTPGRAKQRALLAMLLLRANEVVGTDQLVEGLWGESPPATAANALHGHVSSLRKRLGVERIETRPAGYRLRVDAGEGLDRAVRDPVEDPAGVAETLGERASELEVELPPRVGRHRAIHALHLDLELPGIDCDRHLASFVWCGLSGRPLTRR